MACYGFSNSHVRVWHLDCKESWVLKTLEHPLDCNEIQPAHSKGNQPWTFIGRTDAEAETPIIWPPDVKNRLIRKDPDAWKGWRQEEKETTEDETDGWMASLTQWTWIWAISRSWWWTGKPGVLQTMESQRVGHDLMIELNWIILPHFSVCVYVCMHVCSVVSNSFLPYGL